MKTLYIDINNNPIQNTDEVICVSDKGTLLNDFFYELGCSILSKSGINVPKAQLISGFNLPENVYAYATIIKQWEELKVILFCHDVEGEFNVHLPKEYMSWLGNHSNQEYRAVCKKKNYDCTKGHIITIDVEEFYDNYINDDFVRLLVKTLRENSEIEQIVFNDNAVTKHSRIVKSIRDHFDVSFLPYEIWNNTESPNVQVATYIGETRVITTDVLYSNIGIFSCGRCLVQNAKTGLYGYIDEQGKEVIPCRYKNALQFIKGNAWTLYGSTYMWIIIDLSGQYIGIGCGGTENLSVEHGIIRSDRDAYYDYNGRLLAQSDKLTNVYLQGNELVKTRNGHRTTIDLGDYEASNHQLVIKKKNDKYGVILDDVDSISIIIPFKYKKIEDLCGGFFKLIDENDKQIICKYQ